MTSKKKPEVRILEKKRVYDTLRGKFGIDQYRFEMDKQGGGTQELTRIVFERGHAAAILPYDPVRDEVVLVREMRPGILASNSNADPSAVIDPYSEALPAGMIDPGEGGLETGCREMLEETGLELRDATVIHPNAFVSPGGASEYITMIVGVVDASKAGGIHGKESEGEDIQSVVLSSDEFIQRAEKGAIKDMKTLMAAFWLAVHRQELREKYAPSAPKQNVIKP